MTRILMLLDYDNLPSESRPEITSNNLLSSTLNDTI
jgi:hypothetical protein